MIRGYLINHMNDISTLKLYFWDWFGSEIEKLTFAEAKNKSIEIIKTIQCINSINVRIWVINRIFDKKMKISKIKFLTSNFGNNFCYSFSKIVKVVGKWSYEL
jgi:hypothetical protein